MKKTILFLAFTALSSLYSFAQNNVSTAFYNSYSYEYNKEYDKAIQTLNTVYNEKSYDINLRLGWLNYAKGDYLKSQTYYKAAVKLIPKSIEAKLGLIYPLSALQNWNEVLKTYEQILAIDAYHSKSNYQVAYIYFVRKDFNKAYVYAKKAFEVYPFDYDTNLLLGRINISLGNISEAKMHLNKALNYSPASEEIISLLKSL